MPRVAVVGGSIGGLTAALLLRDAGCEVEVYERTTVPLSGFGAGIVVQPELVRYFLERTSITVEQISVPSSAMRYWNGATGEPRGQVPADWRYTSYNALYRGLLDSWGPDRHHFGEALVGLHQSDEAVELRFASGRVATCELAVCADGGFSTARRQLLDIGPRYAGYVTWRGLAGRERLSKETWAFFDDAFNYGLLDDGHLIAYPIPVVDEAELRVADRQVNWQWYWNVPEGPELDELMTDNEGARRPVTVHHDLLQRRYLVELHTRAASRLMAPFAELLTRSERPFVTVIADTSTPRMAVGRCALIGDAAVTIRPHAAAGGAKAAANAWSLAEALVAAQGDVHEALRRWEPMQLEQGYALLAKVRRMGASLQHGGPFEPGDRANRFGMPALLEPL